MSITMHTGRPGTGKTYNAVREVIKLLNNGEIVYSNIKIFWNGYEEKRTWWKDILIKIKIKEKYKKYPKNNLRFWTKLEDLYKIEDGTIFIDEAHVYMNSRRWKNLPVEMEKKLAQHRKDGLHIIGTVQSVNRLDTIFRELIDYWFVYENGYFFFVRWEFNLDDDKQKKYPLSRRYFRKKKKIYEMYDTLEKVGINLGY